MPREIIEFSSDVTKAPAGSELIETQDSNLDVMKITTTRNIQLNDLEEVEYKDFNSNVIFAGAVRNKKTGATNTAFIYSYNIELGEIPIRKNYENQTPVQIIEDIITNFTRLTFVNNGVSTSQTIPLYPARAPASVVIDTMLQLLGATSRTDKDKNYTIEFEGTNINSIVLEIGNNCFIRNEGWDIDSTNIVKTLTVEGDKYRTSETVFLSGDGTTTEFTLDNPFVSINIEHPVNTQLKATVDDVTDGDYEIFKETRKIVFKTAPSNGTDNIKIVYEYEIQANWQIGSPSLKVSNNENPHNRTIEVKTLKTVESCKNYAQNYYNKFSKGLREAKIVYSKSFDPTLFAPNERIRVIDNQIGIEGNYIDEEFIIKEVRRNFGSNGAGITLIVGDSSQFVYNREFEIKNRIDELKQSNPTAEIFNVGLLTDGTNPVLIEYDFEVDLKVATLPTDIGVHDVSRIYTDEADKTVGTLENFDTNNGTVNGGVTISEDGAMVFDGVDGNYVQINKPFTISKNSGFTVCAWVETTDLDDTSQSVISNVQSGFTNGWNLEINKFVLEGIDGNQTSTNAAPITEGYNFLCGKYENNQIFFYKNGILQDVVNYNSFNGTTTTEFTDIGRYRPNNIFNLKGSVKNVIMYNKGLSQSEIQQINDAGVDSYSPIGDSLVAQYRGADFAGTSENPTTIYDTNYIVENNGSRGIQFDGVDDEVYLNNSNIINSLNSNNFTLSFSIKKKTFSSREVIFGNSGVVHNRQIIINTDGTLRTSEEDISWINIVNFNSYLENEINHIIWKYDSTTSYLYINNILVDSDNYVFSDNYNGDYFIGDDIYSLNGSIYNLQIHNKSLNSTERTQVFNGEVILDGLVFSQGDVTLEDKKLIQDVTENGIIYKYINYTKFSDLFN